MTGNFDNDTLLRNMDSELVHENQRRADAINSVFRAKTHQTGPNLVFTAYDAAVAYDIADLLHGVSAELPHPPDSAFGERPLPSKPINAAVANAIRDAKFPKPIAKAPDTEPLPVASVID